MDAVQPLLRPFFIHQVQSQVLLSQLEYLRAFIVHARIGHDCVIPCSFRLLGNLGEVPLFVEEIRGHIHCFMNLCFQGLFTKTVEDGRHVLSSVFGLLGLCLLCWVAVLVQEGVSVAKSIIN